MDENNQFKRKYQSILVVGKLGGWEYYCDTKELYCSHEYFVMLGRGDQYPASWAKYSVKEVWEDFLHPDDLANATACFAEYLQKREGTYEQVFRLQHANGNWIWVLSRGMAIKSKASDSNPSLIIGAHIDISSDREKSALINLQKQLLFKDNTLLKSILNSPQNFYIIAFDTNYNLTVFTDSYLNFAQTVLKKEVFVGMNAFDIIPSELHDFALANYNRAIKGESFTLTNPLLAPNGELYYYENRYSPIIDANGSIHGFTLFVNDITTIKKAEEVTKINELRYTALFNGAVDAIFIADVDTGIIVDANDQASALIGYPKSEIIGMHQTQLHPKQEFDFIREQFNRFRLSNEFNSVECSAIHKSGKIIPVLVSSGKPFKVGNNTYSAGYFKDLSKDKQAEENMATLKNILMRAEGIANLGTIEIDLVNNKRIWSDEFYRILGLKPQSILPDKDLFLSLIHPDDREKYEGWYNESLHVSAPIEPIDVRITTIDGIEKYLFISAINHTNDMGTVDRSFGMVKDVTEITQTLVELRKQNQQLKEIAWTQSHLVRAPLSRMLGLILLLQKGILNKNEEIEFIQHIKDSAEELDRIIKDIVYTANGLAPGDFKNT